MSAMKWSIILVFCVSYQCDVTTGYTLDYVCNDDSTYVPLSGNTYIISSSQYYASLCKVKFESITNAVVLTISGSSLDCSMCHVSVWDGYDVVIQSGGDICSVGYFQKSYTSGIGGALNLHVQGTGCATAGLVFEVRQQGCDVDEFTCDNGQCVMNFDRCDRFNDCSDGSDEDGCFWGVGTYVGFSVGSFVLICIIAGVAGVYRRRVIQSRGVVVVPQGQTVVTQSRW